MNLKDKNLAYLPQYYCSHGNALVAFSGFVQIDWKKTAKKSVKQEETSCIQAW